MSMDRDPYEPVRPPLNPFLVVGSVACGIGAFVAAMVLSAFAGELGADDTVGVKLMGAIVVFLLLVVGCIMLGYVAARRRGR